MKKTLYLLIGFKNFFFLVFLIPVISFARIEKAHSKQTHNLVDDTEPVFVYKRSSMGTIGLNFFGDILYWNAKSGGKEALYSAVFKGESDEKVLDYGWNIGYKIGSDFQVPLLKWNISAVYTVFSSNNGSEKQISQRSSIDYSSINLAVKKGGLVADLICLKTATGYRKTSLRQSFGNIKENANEEMFENETFFNAQGPSFGISADWNIPANISINSSFTGSILYGSVSRQNIIPADKSITDFRTLTPASQVFLGFDWKSSFKDLNYALKLGYEAEYLWYYDFEKLLYNLNADEVYRNTVFYGLTSRATVEF